MLHSYCKQRYKAFLFIFWHSKCSITILFFTFLEIFIFLVNGSYLRDEKEVM